MTKEQQIKLIKVELVDGVEGMSLYLNDYRVAGPKPWGGGKLLKSWHTDISNILEAIKQKDEN